MHRTEHPQGDSRPPLCLRYVRAAPLPHALAGLCLLFSWALFGLSGVGEPLCMVDSDHPGRVFSPFLLRCSALGWLGLALLAQRDAYCRYAEFVRVRGVLRRRGFSPRIFRLLSTSRCQRDAGLLAARESGCLHQARGFFHALGYRWFHLLPDRVVRNPLHFLSPVFLRATFGPVRMEQGARGR